MPSARNPSANEEQTSEAARGQGQNPARIGERYHVHALLGRGGMAAVYRVTDARGGPDRALKQLLWSGPQHERAAVEALFEREFQTLVELDHPRVIRVYEYVPRARRWQRTLGRILSRGPAWKRRARERSRVPGARVGGRLWIDRSTVGAWR